jgi:hypothetical protein
MKPQASRGTLTDRYFEGVYSLPSKLRCRGPLEETVMKKIRKGGHVCVRGLWRIGKTELMMGAIDRICTGEKASGLFFDLRSPEHEDQSPKTAEEVRSGIEEKILEFLKQMEIDVPVDKSNPLSTLGAIDQRIYLGMDELVALEGLGTEQMRGMLREFKAVPDNVSLIVVCHKHRNTEEIFDSEIVQDPRFSTVYIPPINAKELEHIVQSPAWDFGVEFSDDALGRISQLSGDRPWEIFIACFMVANSFEYHNMLRPGLLINGEQVDSIVSLENLKRYDTGEEVLLNYGRVLHNALTAKELELAFDLAAGKKELQSRYRREIRELVLAARVIEGAVPRIRGELFEEFIQKVSNDEINIGE